MFPQFDKPFHVYTDASNYQLGAVIMQENKPLAFYSRKLTDTQKRYTTGEQELFSICLLYTSPSPRDQRGSRMPSSA